MSLGSRILKRGRAAISVPACPASTPTPREPLLFLYPQWTRKATNAAKASNRDGDLEKAEENSNASPQEDLGKMGDKTRTNEGNSAANRKLISEDKDGLPNTLSILDRPDWHRKSQVLERRSLRASTGPSNSKETKLSVAVRRIITKHEVRKVSVRRDEGVRRQYQERRLEEQGHVLPDWRSILRELDLHTSARSATWHDNALRVKVPSTAVGEFLFHPDNNIWRIKDRTGCHIELTEDWDVDNEDNRALLLSGPVTCIAKAAAEITRIIPTAKSDGYSVQGYSQHFGTQGPSRHLSSEQDSGLELRYVASEKRKLLAQPMRADKIPRPSTWNHASFGFYIERLTSMKMSNHIHQFIYKKGGDHVNTVVGILREVFVDPNTRSAISATAFNKALTFLVKHNQMEDVRILFVHMQLQQLRMDTETFNIMLRGAAKSRDLHNFHFLLGLMLKRGIVPDAGTWVAFLMAIDDFQIKLRVLVRMKEKEFLGDISVKKSVCEHLVSDEINWSLDKEKSASEFLLHMGERYGKDWLTVSSANRVVNALASRGLISRCWDFIEFMHSKDIKPNAVTINTILYHCKEQHNQEGAVEILYRVGSLLDFVPDQVTYEMLFNMAWSGGLYNVSMVVWRYACLNAATTVRMRNKMRNSFVMALSPNPRLDTTVNFWRATVGLFIIGATGSESHPPKLSSPVSSTTPPILDAPTTTEVNLNSPPPTITTTTISNPYFHTLHQSLKLSLPVIHDLKSTTTPTRITTKILQQNLSAFKTFKPQRRLADVLRQALDVDRAWREERKLLLRGAKGEGEGKEGEDDAMRLLVRNAVPVPLLRRDGRRMSVLESGFVVSASSFEDSSPPVSKGVLVHDSKKEEK